jgi:selenocysteine-specific elongation factor
MYVLATAGHVDHGKSTLVRSLTGMEPDRLDEERSRGLTIELGYAWRTLPSGRQVAFVDVPGHEKFLGTMLAGVGPVPAALFVVAADEGWMPQSEEHLTALDALGVRHGLLVVTRSDLADPEPALVAARRRLASSTLGSVPALAVSAATGAGLSALLAAIEALVDRLPPPDRTGPVRFWLDRVFTIRGSGVVVTGTLGAGSIKLGDHLAVSGTGRTVHVRGIQTLERPVPEASAVARVAVNLRGADHTVLSRGMALLTPGRWAEPATVDVQLDRSGQWAGDRDGGRDGGRAGEDDWSLPIEAVLHIGSGHTVARIRPLAADNARLVARLTLREPLPLHVGDRALLRDPGQARGETRILARATVLDVDPPDLRRRGAADRRGRLLLSLPGIPDGAAILAQRGVLRAADLARMGVQVPPAHAAGEWLMDTGYRRALSERLAGLVARYAEAHPLEPTMPVDAARRALGLPDRRLVEAVVPQPLRLAAGRIGRPDRSGALPEPLAEAVDRVLARLAGSPFRAPEHDDLAALGLDRRGLAAAERAGRLLRVTDGVVLAPDADVAAAGILRDLPQPFTAADARRALDTTRRVVIPLLELLDRKGLTDRIDGNLRRVRTPT